MKTPDNPCFRCEHRSARCHATCAEYAAFAQERSESRDGAQHSKASAQNYFGVTSRRYKRWPKKRKPNT